MYGYLLGSEAVAVLVLRAADEGRGRRTAKVVRSSGVTKIRNVGGTGDHRRCALEYVYR